MSANQKQGQMILKTLFIRLFLLSVPASILTQYGPKMLTASPLAHMSTSQMMIWEFIISAVAAISLFAIIKPKVLIKPALGAGLFWFVCYELKNFSYTGPFHGSIRELIIYSAGAACAYLVCYDFVHFIGRMFQSLQRKFSPSVIPSWAGTFNNTQEKGDALEAYVCDLYKRLYGNAITTTDMKKKGLIPDGPGDQGADVIVDLPENRKLAIQCKNVSSPMGNSAVQEIMTAKAYYKADELAIVSPMGFTERCIELAQSQGRYYGIKIELIDSSRLDELNRIAQKNAA